MKVRSIKTKKTIKTAMVEAAVVEEDQVAAADRVVEAAVEAAVVVDVEAKTE